MTTRVGNVVIIAAEGYRTCELCGAVDECRPYGPEGKQVCFECGQKNPEALKAALEKLFGGGRS